MFRAVLEHVQHAMCSRNRLIKCSRWYPHDGSELYRAAKRLSECMRSPSCRYQADEPHQQPLPGHWQQQIGNTFTKLLLIKLLREEKLIFASQQYVAMKLGKEFTDYEPWTLDEVFQETNPYTPVIFILSTGTGWYGRAWHLCIAASWHLEQVTATAPLVWLVD